MSDPSSTADARAMALHRQLDREGEEKNSRANGVELLAAFQALLEADAATQVAFTRQTIARIAASRQAWKEAVCPQCESLPDYADFVQEQAFPHTAARALIGLLRRPIPFRTNDVVYLLKWTGFVGTLSTWYYPHLSQLVQLAEKEVQRSGRTPELDTAIASVAKACANNGRREERRLSERLVRLVSDVLPVPIEPGEAWADRAIADLDGLPPARREMWIGLLVHGQESGTGAPSAAWLKKARTFYEALGAEEFRRCVTTWFPLVDKPRTHPLQNPYTGATIDDVIVESNGDVLKGLAAAAAFEEDVEVARALADLAISSYRKIPNIGPRLVRVGNACVWALGRMPGKAGVGPLAVLDIRVKFGTARKQIAKALTETARRLNLPVDEIQELAVPTYGLGPDGLRREALGEYGAELAVAGASTVELRWSNAAGKTLKSIPAAARRDHGAAIKALQAASKDVQRMLSAQRERIDQLFLARRTWPLGTWQERYLEHPVVGAIARGLIWRLSDGERTEDVFILDGQLQTRAGRAPDLSRTATVALWHPSMSAADEVLAWRRWLEERELRQPFKQAHREVYLLTDAERSTRVYSNRFAAHVLRQHQFSALCAARGWRNPLRLMVDAEFPPATRLLPAWNLRAEFWVEGLGDEYGRDTNETGTFYRLSSDQVRFYPLDAPVNTAHASGGSYGVMGNVPRPEPVLLETIPPLVLSEILRDVDLFVGVSSIGNDPTWHDGGPEGRYVAYWRDYAFGELSQPARMRHDVLSRLLPRLRIADRCTLSDRFLVVRGNLRTYKIHLGSGNILMEPNDQYLCIVRAPSSARGKTDRLYLPFEGDEQLAVILSKAFLLADDTRITDPTIVQQIGGK